MIIVQMHTKFLYFRINFCNWSYSKFSIEKLHLSWLEPIFYEKNIHIFFNKQPSYYGSNVKNGLKVKQLAKHHPTLKTLTQKILVGP